MTSSDQLWERVGVECITKWASSHLQISSPAVFRAGRRSGIGLSQITLSQKKPLPLSEKLQRKSVDLCAPSEPLPGDSRAAWLLQKKYCGWSFIVGSDMRR